MNEDEYRALQQEALAAANEAMSRPHVDSESLMVRAMEEARRQEGPIVCRVLCQRCLDDPARKPKVLATVRKVKRGLYFEAEFVTDSTRQVTRERARMVREQFDQHYPDGNREVLTLLLDMPPEWPQDWPPRAQCRVHGDDVLSRSEMLRVRRSAPGKAVRVTIHRGAQC